MSPVRLLVAVTFRVESCVYHGWGRNDIILGSCRLGRKLLNWICRLYVQACLLEDDGPLLEAMAASRYAIGGSAFSC